MKLYFYCALGLNEATRRRPTSIPETSAPQPGRNRADHERELSFIFAMQTAQRELRCALRPGPDRRRIGEDR